MKRLLLPVLVFLLGSCAWAQTSGEVTVTVKDSSGAVVPGAKVTVAKVVATGQTDNAGSLRVRGVAFGEHLLLVESLGFLLWVREGVAIEGNQVSQVDAELSVAPMKESVVSQNELPPRAVDWYSELLHIMKEPGLCEVRNEPGMETYRFLWIRTWMEPILVRVEIRGDGPARMILKRATPEQETRKHTLKSTKVSKLTSQDAEFVQMLLGESGFWEIPSEINPGTITVDGASWVFEGSKDGKCHAVERDTPADGPVRQLGLGFLLSVAKLKLLYQEVF